MGVFLLFREQKKIIKKMRKQIFTAILIPVFFLVFAQNAKSVEPFSEPLLQQSNLEYVGAFRLPITGMYNGAMAFRPATAGALDGSLYMQNDYHGGNPLTAEIKIPAIVNVWNKTLLNVGTTLQNLTDTTAGNRLNIGTSGTAVSNTWNPRQAGYLVYNNKLIGTLVSDYNASILTHYTANLDWSGGIGFNGFYKVGNTVDNNVSSSGYVGGYMATIPNEWQSYFGGAPAVTGLVASSIASRTSWGPALFSFDPGQLGGAYGTEVNPTPATPLVYYNSAHPLGDFSWADKINSVVFPDGSGTVLFFGEKGLSGECYGLGTSNYSEVGGPFAEAGHTCNGDAVSINDSCCYDANSHSHGDHGYPYAPFVWAYRATDLLDVKNGVKQPWEISAYTSWQLELPAGFPPINITHAAYDSTTQRIYLSGLGSDRGNSSANPLIYVMHVAFNGTPPQTEISHATQIIPTSLLSATSITLTCKGSGIGCTIKYRWDNQSSFTTYTDSIPAQYGVLYVQSTDSNGQGPLEYRAYAGENYPITINDTLAGNVSPGSLIYLTCYGLGLWTNCATSYAWDNGSYVGSNPSIQATVPSSIGTHVLHYKSTDSTGTSPVQSVSYVVGSDATAPDAPSGLSVQ